MVNNQQQQGPLNHKQARWNGRVGTCPQFRQPKKQMTVNPENITWLDGGGMYIHSHHETWGTYVQLFVTRMSKPETDLERLNRENKEAFESNSEEDTSF